MTDTQRDLRAQLDRWYTEYCKEHNDRPTLQEMIDKAKELGLDEF